MKKFKPVKFIDKVNGKTFSAEQMIVEYAVVENSKPSYGDFKKWNNFMSENLGYYFHLLYGDILCLNLEPQMLVRFLKLCSYLNYQSILVVGETKGQKKITEKELQTILNLSRNEASRTKSYLIQNNLIKIERDNIKICSKFIKRGQLKGDVKNMKVARIFNDGIQQLYDSVKPNQHKKLASFIRLLPYINTRFNVIAHNINAINFDESEPMKSTEIAAICNYEKPSRFIKELMSLKINNQFAIVRIVRGDRDFFVVNPRLFYKCNNIEDLKYIMNFFDYK